MVSISLSSGFSFQVSATLSAPCRLSVSISLSSGFSFQGKIIIFITNSSLVSISLSSGFSFQVACNSVHQTRCKFQSRYRAASHFRFRKLTPHPHLIKFQSRYRAASHFRFRERATSDARDNICFNLVIERLLISGINEEYHLAAGHHVSISLSSGFSFQVNLPPRPPSSGQVSISLSSGFSFQVRPRRAPDTLWLNARTSASVHFQRDDAC